MLVAVISLLLGLWLVLSMITDVSANSHTDGENDDNEHNNGDVVTSSKKKKGRSKVLTLSRGGKERIE